MRWRHVCTGLLFLLASCGGDNLLENSDSLSADEQRYADEIATTAADQGFTVEESKCMGGQLVRAFGLSRAKQLDLAGEDTPAMKRADAEKSIGILDDCANLRLVIVREAQQDLKLSDEQVTRCAQLLDQSKVREMFVQAQMNQEVPDDLSQDLQKDLLAALARCR
jgi:hypothetical protein